MKFADRVRCCHASGSIYRKGNPSKKYLKHVSTGIMLEERVPKSEQQYEDWEEYDPDEEYGHY